MDIQARQSCKKKKFNSLIVYKERTWGSSLVWLRADGSWEQQGLSLLVSPGGELRDITSKDSLLRPVLILGNKEAVAVLLHHRKGQMGGEAKSLCHLGRLFDPLHLRVCHSRWCPQGKVAWLGYSDLLPYYLVCAHYWL